MERFIIRWRDAYGKIKERLLNEKQYKRFQESKFYDDDLDTKRLQVIKVEFDSIFDE